MDKTDAVIVWIVDVHFTIAPALIGGFQVDDDTPALQFSMKLIYIFDANKNHSTRYSITRKRGNM
jgi:hypothetical protein